jgi:hypothetical protein
MAKKAVRAVKRAKKDAPQRGRPSASLSGDEVIGRRVPRGLHPKWWRCDNVRERMIPREHGGGHVVEYRWVSRCTCGARMEEWKRYTLPPVAAADHRLPAKCEACNDRVTGRDQVGDDEAVAVAPVASEQDRAQAARVLNVFTVDTPGNREAAHWMTAANWDAGFKALVRSTLAGVRCEYMTEQFISELANNG